LGYVYITEKGTGARCVIHNFSLFMK
jgi:hypothetical protein